LKPFIIAIYALFLFAMITGLVVAFRNSEGLVETDYYRKQNSWFQEKTEERRLGLEVMKPASIQRGENELTFVLTEHGKPLTHAGVQLFVGNVSTSELDITCTMHETTPGTYQARATVPSKGKWLLRIDITNNKLNTSQSWFYDVN
jgi:hypothetical protein